MKSTFHVPQTPESDRLLVLAADGETAGALTAEKAANPTPSMVEGIVEWLRRASSAIYLATEKVVADDISPRLKTAANEIETLRKVLDELLHEDSDKSDEARLVTRLKAKLLLTEQGTDTASMDPAQSRGAQSIPLPPICSSCGYSQGRHSPECPDSERDRA